jgi:hypothetical protein
MKIILKRYYPVKGSEGKDGNTPTHRMVKCYLSYEFGSANLASGRDYPMGYYAHAVPVSLKDYEDGTAAESCVAFSGGKWLLFECTRPNPKKEAKARKLFEERHRDLVGQLMKDSPDLPNVDFDHPEK